MKILVTYASAHGSTAEVAAFVGRNMMAYDVDVVVAHADTVETIDEFDVVVMGSAIHASMWLPSLTQFMFRFEKQLLQKQLFMWLNCIIILEEGGLQQAQDSYIWDQALNKIGLQRENITFLAGKLTWDKIDPNEKWLLSTNYEGKELPGNQSGDFRDWVAISNWVHGMMRQLGVGLSFPEVVSDERAVKDETISTQEVKQLRWPDNPVESGKI